MKDIEFKILDILSREIGNPVSIRQLNEEVSRIYGASHYPAIYSQIQDMAKRRILNIDKYGKSSIASLNFDNSLLIDSLAQVELIRKINFLEERKDWQSLALQINGYLKNIPAIKSIIITRPEINAKLNRLELFILTHNTDSKSLDLNETRKILEQLQRIHNVRIDYMMINEEAFEGLLRHEDANLIKEIMSDKIVLFHTEDFWFMIKNILDKGIRIQVEKNPVLLSKIADKDIAFNLARFGYKEMGTTITHGVPIGIEYIVTSILLKKDNIRRLEAIPIILAKNNEKINYHLLVFLASKFKVIRQLYDILKVLNDLKPTKEVKEIMKEISHAMVQKIKGDQKELELHLKDMEKKMRLYNVIE